MRLTCWLPRWTTFPPIMNYCILFVSNVSGHPPPRLYTMSSFFYRFFLSWKQIMKHIRANSVASRIGAIIPLVMIHMASSVDHPDTSLRQRITVSTLIVVNWSERKMTQAKIMATMKRLKQDNPLFLFYYKAFYLRSMKYKTAMAKASAK